MSRPTSFDDFLVVDTVEKDLFVSRWPAESNTFDPKDKTAYGGCLFALAISAAYETVQDAYRLYSCTGVFLGPGMVGERARIAVTRIRDTRTFATRRLDVSQIVGEKTRQIMTMLLDFQAPEKTTLLTFSAEPTVSYSEPEQSLTDQDIRDNAKSQGIPEKLLAVLDGAMGSRKNYFKLRTPPESFASDKLHGMLPQIGTLQKDLSITEKYNCNYWHSLTPLRSHAANVAALGFILDAGMPVVPMAFAGLDMKKISGLASLDFAMRVFNRDIDTYQYLKREEKTVVGGEGRTFTEARLWDMKGNMVASMSQQCLLRARESKAKM